MSRLYEREIKDFFEGAKIKMTGTTKEAKGKFGKVSLCVCSLVSVCVHASPLFLFVSVGLCFPHTSDRIGPSLWSGNGGVSELFWALIVLAGSGHTISAVANLAHLCVSAPEQEAELLIALGHLRA